MRLPVFGAELHVSYVSTFDQCMFYIVGTIYLFKGAAVAAHRRNLIYMIYHPSELTPKFSGQGVMAYLQFEIFCMYG